MASGRMVALLGLLAVLGYQNRDRIGELLNRVSGRPQPLPAGDGAASAADGSGGIGGFLGNLFGGREDDGAAPERGAANGGFFAGLGNLFNGQGGIGDGLRDLVDQFTGRGHGDEAKSWVEIGPNREISPSALEEALGEDTIAELTQQTGLGREELLARLRTVLPTAVDTLTPEGRLDGSTAVGGAAPESPV